VELDICFFFHSFTRVNIEKTRSSKKSAGPPKNTLTTATPVVTKEAACQTLSTGDIVITKIYFKEDQDKQPEKVITSSPRRNNQTESVAAVSQ
jgi:hypothetical protein